MAAKKKKKPVPTTWDCPNPRSPYTLWELVRLLENDSEFADFFSQLLKSANNNEKGAIECVDSYLAPTTDELQALGIGASQWNSLRKCTESGLLVAVITQQAAGKVK
ncbi:MAG: hypothetical protein QOG27_605 [Verrucomicrobiota bacterium]|jgi:hypothetical protein